MEHPMDKILTMILFSAIKKAAVTVVKRDPLELTVAETLPEDMRQYEIDFAEAFKWTNKKERLTKLQNTMADLITSVGTKMKGFSRKETIEYYKSIMEKAWTQIEAAETPEVRSEVYEEVMDWTLLDKNYDDRTREVFTNRPIFTPMWWGRWDPTYQPASYTGTGTTGFRTEHPFRHWRHFQPANPARFNLRCLRGRWDPGFLPTRLLAMSPVLPIKSPTKPTRYQRPHPGLPQAVSAAEGAVPVPVPVLAALVHVPAAGADRRLSCESNQGFPEKYLQTLLQGGESSCSRCPSLSARR